MDLKLNIKDTILETIANESVSTLLAEKRKNMSQLLMQQQLLTFTSQELESALIESIKYQGQIDFHLLNDPDGKFKFAEQLETKPSFAYAIQNQFLAKEQLKVIPYETSREEFLNQYFSENYPQKLRLELMTP